MPKQRPPKQPPTSSETQPAEPFNDPEKLVAENTALREFEYVLAASLDPDYPGEIKLEALLDLFAATVHDAHKRKFSTDEFPKVLNRCTEAFALGARLQAAGLYSTRMKELGTPVPDIEQAMDEIVQRFRVLRKEAVETLKVCMTMRAPSAKLH